MAKTDTEKVTGTKATTKARTRVVEEVGKRTWSEVRAEEGTVQEKDRERQRYKDSSRSWDTCRDSVEERSKRQDLGQGQGQGTGAGPRTKQEQ